MTPAERHAQDPANSYSATGTFYRLPDGLTWEDVATMRQRWGHDPMHAPLAIGPGCVAWGTLLPSNYERAEP